ncbi:sentrin-specific protease 7-like isoform X3 [Echeneis naucrates]|uniref:sentrin-specific protease 7-like isoform X3 n=1 Tax=Echeneis naucrates TaxID=173247 RepID=UPI0011138CA5|nr:sentrin-specific protease 7-like isoform X3 [Echeneis naucrates]
MHAGNTIGSSNNRQSRPCQPLFSDIMKTLLGLNSPNTGAASTANHRSPGRMKSQSKQGQIMPSSSSSNGWRPKRASDRLLLPEVTSEWRQSPPQKRIESPSLSSMTKSVSVKSVDTLAKLRGDGYAGRCSPSMLGGSTWRRVEHRRDAVDGKRERCSDHTSEDNFVSPSTKVPRRSSSSSSSVTLQSPTSGGRQRLDTMSWIASSSSPKEDVSEKEKQRWIEFRDRKTTKVCLRRNTKQSPAEPIVLSSEEEEEAKTTHQSGRQVDKSCLGNLDNIQGPQTGKQISSSGADGRVCRLLPSPSFLQLQFTSLHAGLMHTDARGDLMITENGITVPLKVSGGGEGPVTVVASELRGYGIWDGGKAQGGDLLAGWEGPAPSLLFLWVTDAQANLLQRELSAIMSSTPSGPPCTFLLLVLKEQLQDLQTALLTSILDMEEFKKGRLSSSVGPSSPLGWTDGLLLLHSCPPPVDEHFLGLLGHSAMRTNQRRKNNLNSSGLQQLPTRLIQYPAAPCKGRISVTKEDLACLGSGEFLNDVIIDFYLKSVKETQGFCPDPDSDTKRYLVLEGVGGVVAQQTHVFSSFFYKQLSRRRAAGEDDAPSLPDRHMRHQRVKTWTRHVDIFTKDFLFVPVNQEAHWFLVVVCFPGLETLQYEEFPIRTGGSERSVGKPDFILRPRPPECTELGRLRDRVLRRPCILVMDSLKLSYHENVCRLLRDYLQVEWEVRRGKPRLFTPDTMKSSNCRVPQQDNSSDCGLYLLQYAESFLQNPIVHFELPVHLENWFPRQQMRKKREEIRSLIMNLHESQQVKDQD